MGCMKFTNIMRRLLFSFAFIVLGSSSIAQPTTNSPYSSFGIGESGDLDHATMLGVGNSTATMIDSFTLNYYNPASYNQISPGQPLFSLGISSRLSNYSENGVKSFSNISTLQHFAMAFPIRKHFGLAFGLKPYSRKGYEFSERFEIGTDSLKNTYSGSGGFNEVFIGISTDLLPKADSTRLSIGANFGYLFGQASNQRTSTLLISGQEKTGGVDIRTIKATSFHYNLGLYFSHDFNPNHSILVSGMLEPSQKLTASYDYGLYYSTDVTNPNFYDTVFYSEATSGRITTALQYTAGLRYTMRRTPEEDEKHSLNSELSIHATYRGTGWNNFNIPFDGDSTVYLNTNKYTFGLQYIPETGFLKNRTLTKFYQRMRYRVGGYYMTLPYQTSGEQVRDFGTTFGLGLPIAAGGSISSVNLGFSVGRRGVSDSQSLMENYYGINFGVTISPIGDKWFQKRKLN